MATCKNDGTLGACICEDGAGSGGASGSSGSSSAGTGGVGGSSGSSAGGSGGTAGGDDDGGTPPAQDGGQQPPSNPNVPSDGNQGTPCENDRECNRGLGCYGAGSGGGFCSKACERDEDCADLAGATFHCGQSDVCSVECEGPDDDASCPAGMVCEEVGGGQNGGDGDGRCLYPGDDPGPEQGAAFDACEGRDSCMDGLDCAGDGMGRMGFCSHECTPEDSDCSDVMAATGSITATCVPQNPELGVCALDCEAQPDGCPEGMECVEQGFYMLCRYMDN